MHTDKYNSEHYADPTAAQALANVEREEKAKVKPCVFICSPYAGDISRNVQNAKRYLKFAADQGMTPFAPHLLYPQIMDDSDPAQRNHGLLLGIIWLGKCDAIWVFGSRISPGMAAEIDWAKEHHIPVRYFTENCEEV